jgi:hypothetical protein
VVDAELEVDFEDSAKDFTVNGNDTLNIKIHLDAIMTKITTLASQNLLLIPMETELLKLALITMMVIMLLRA